MDKTLPLDDSSDSEIDLKINKDYAEKYENWRHKEELQKLKDKYGDETDTTSSSESDGNEPVIERDFLKTLSLLKSKDPKIYDENVSFFTEEEQEKKREQQKKPLKAKKAKPLLWKDYERKVLLEGHGELSDENENAPDMGPTYVKEQQEIIQSFANALKNSDDDDGDLLRVRKKTESELEKEESEYILWMKNEAGTKTNDEENKDLKCLRDLWNDPKLDEGERFLRDYILNEKYKEKKSKQLPTYDEIVDDIGDLSDDEKILNEQELFEHKFNFRFEEPDSEFVKQYPRTVKDSLRRTKDKRRLKREDYRERKLQEKKRKKEEILRLKALKRKEIEDKLSKLKEITGNEQLAFSEVDLKGDFDPQEHDRKMAELYGNEYYEAEEAERPHFPEDEELDCENWDNWTGNVGVDGYYGDEYHNVPHCEDPDFNIDADYNPKLAFQTEMIDTSQRKSRKRESYFASAVKRKKRVFDPTSEAFEDYFDEYYKLDYEDIIGDMPVRFKYRKVIPNDFGLSVEEVLTAKDKELNRWCSLKKTCQYRSEQEELYDVQAFRKKALNENIRRKVFLSIYEDGETLNKEKTAACSDKESKKRKRKKKSVSSEEMLTNSDKSANIGEGTGGQDKSENSGSSLTDDIAASLDNSAVLYNPKKRNKLQTADSTLCENGSGTIVEEISPKCDGPPKKRRRTRKKKNSPNEVPFPIRSENCDSIAEKVQEGACTKKKEASSNLLNNKIPSTNCFSEKKLKFRRKQVKSEGIEDKRLTLSDERLRAYGINPKKFKNNIKYSQKR